MYINLLYHIQHNRQRYNIFFVYEKVIKDNFFIYRHGDRRRIFVGQGDSVVFRGRVASQRRGVLGVYGTSMRSVFDSRQAESYAEKQNNETLRILFGRDLAMLYVRGRRIRNALDDGRAYARTCNGDTRSYHRDTRHRENQNRKLDSRASHCALRSSDIFQIGSSELHASLFDSKAHYVQRTGRASRRSYHIRRGKRNVVQRNFFDLRFYIDIYVRAALYVTNRGFS